MKLFIPATTAIGKLVIAGFKVEFKNQHIVVEGHDPIYAFRDGTDYAVKAEYILDILGH